MGMAASQARLLSLQARQSNLEYQGQQINQERSILSQQCTALYNSLLAMKVPTPPSTSDYTTVQYTGADGATTFTIGSVKPSGENYCVELKTSATGKSLSKDYGTASCGKSGTKLVGDYISSTETVKTGKYTAKGLENTPNLTDDDIVLSEETMTGADFKATNPENLEDYMILVDGEYKKVSKLDDIPDNATVYKIATADEYNAEGANKADFTVLSPETEEVGIKIPAGDIDTYYVVGSDGNATPLAGSLYVDLNQKTGEYTVTIPDGMQLFKENVNGNKEVKNPNAGQLTIAGHLAYTFEEAKNNPEFKKFDWGGYETAIKNTFNGEYKPENFMVYFETSNTGITSVKFALTTDVESLDGFTETYSFDPTGSFTESEEVDGCQLEFDSQGMIVKIGRPKYDAAGKLTGYDYVDLKAEKVTDNKAYQDAYNEYEFAQYEYDKKQQEINAKTEIIQQQDRNLELKLQRLDNERTQITTEIEAVEKVINENIEDSYKTFSG